MPDSDMLLPTLPDVARHCQTLIDYRKSRWRPPKPEMEIKIERVEPATPISTAIPTLATMPDASVTLPMPDIRWLVTGIQNGGHYFRFGWPPSLTFCSRPTSDKVDRIIFMSGMVENIWVEVGIAAPSITVEKLFPLPV